MRRITLYSDLECTQQVAQVVTQDYVLPEGKQLYTRIDSYGSTRPDAHSWTVEQLPEPVVYTTRYVAEGESPNEETGSFMTRPSIAATTVAFPLGEPREGPLQPDEKPSKFYIENGIRLDWDYFHDSENDQLKIALWPPKYFTGWSEDEEPEPQFSDSIWIKTELGNSILWVNDVDTQQYATYLTIRNAHEYSNVQLIFVEGDVYFKKTTLPTIGKFEKSFIPVVLATHNGDLECINGYPNSWPSAISINALTSDEIIPPAPDETGETSGMNRDGTGSGLGVSDPAAEIDLNALNSGALNWNGHGSGLTYYTMDLVTFTTKVVGKVYGTLFSNSMEAWGAAIDSVLYPTPDSFAINAETIRACVVSAFMLPDIPTNGTSTSTVWVGPLPIDNLSLTYYLGDRYIEVDDTWLSEIAGHEDFANDGYGDYNDFTHTTATLHLPFVGDIPLNISSLSRGDIRVRAILDQYTGNICYCVYTLSMEAPEQVPILYGIYTGNCAVEIPICSLGSSANVLSRIVNAGSQAVSGIISSIQSGSPVPAALGAFSAITEADTAVASREVVNRGGVLDKNTGPLQTDAVTLQLTRPIPLKPFNRVEIEGIPAATKQPIRQFEGFLKVKSCDLSGLSCEDSEKQKILQLLKEGVYI